MLKVNPSFLAIGGGFFISTLLNAAGFEKNVLWSGKYQGYAGAATSVVNDSQALLFNPAGLGFLEERGDVHLNFSPTFSQSEGGVSSTQASKKSEQGFSPLGGLTSAYRINDRYVVGAGIFASGGTNSRYKGVNSGVITNGESESSLQIIDFSLGGAAQLSKKFSIGAAWRLTYAKAELASVVPLPALGPAAAVQLKLKDLSAADPNGFRVGAQYREDDFGFGLNIRTPVSLTLEGDAQLSGAASGSYSGASASAVFPFQISLGGNYKVSPRLLVLGDLSWSNYSADQKLDLSVSDPTPGPAQVILNGISAADISLKWKDQWVARLGAEYQASEAWAFRGGYALTSQVTSSKHARATFSPPGLGHSFTLGSGYSRGNWDVDLAVDYSIVNGNGEDIGNPSIPKGDFSLTAYTAHVGLAYSY